MYPYGPSSGDYLLPKYDDNFEGPIELGVPVPFFKNVFSTIFISTNGVVSFLSPISKPCSLKKYPITTALISPFWSDINTLVGGRIYYRESSSASDLNQAKNEIANIYSSAFKPSRLYIITWDRVAAFDGRPSVNNTFQLVIATDGKLSFLVFNFGIMSWPNSQFTMNSFFGYNAGDNINYYSYPDSFTNNITNVASKSNVNIPGKWIFIASSSFNLSTTKITKTPETSTTRPITITSTKTTATMSTTKLPGSLIFTLTGHTSWVNTLVTLPNGNLASGSGDSTVRIWNPSTGTLVNTLKGHSDDVLSLATLPNGNLASGSRDYTVKIWNPIKGSLVYSLTGHTREIWTLVTLSNGNLASGSGDSSVKIWNPSTGSLVYTLTGHTNHIWKLSLLSNENLASGSFDRTIKIWNPSTGSLVYTLTGHTDNINTLANLPNGNLASAGSYSDMTVKIWNPNTGSLVYTLTGHTWGVWTLALLPNGNLVSGSNEIKIWNPNTGTLELTVTGCSAKILATLPNGNLAYGNGDNSILIRNSSTGTDLYQLSKHTNQVWTLMTLPNGNLASGSLDYTVRIWAT